MLPVVPFDVRGVGRHMSRTRYQRGTLRTSVPAHGGRPERRLPRGEYWAQWFRYVTVDGKELRRKREKIIDRELAETHRIAAEYAGPITKSDAQRVLDLLIAADAGTYTPPDAASTVSSLAREYLALSEPNWGPREVPVARSIVMRHIAGAPSEASLSET
jgi:hypothetical protein